MTVMSCTGDSLRPSALARCPLCHSRPQCARHADAIAISKEFQEEWTLLDSCIILPYPSIFYIILPYLTVPPHSQLEGTGHLRGSLERRIEELGIGKAVTFKDGSGLGFGRRLEL